MPIGRRQLIRALGGSFLLGVSGFARAAASSARSGDALVLVRQERGLVAVDPRTGTLDPWVEPLPATPSPVASASAPAIVATRITEGTVGYWMTSPTGDASVYRIDTGATSIWWWVRAGGPAEALDLPAGLEPAFPEGTSARWFHGATVEASHLGTGTLRLLAVDLVTGETVLDHELDRRLELAATAVSHDGAIVAHVQSATTGVAFWAADLRGEIREFDETLREDPGVAAASSIDLTATADGDGVLAAAGLAWDWPRAPEPMVYVMHAWRSDVVDVVRVPGELIGIVAGTCP